MPPAPARRWSKRTLVLTVLGLVLASAVLTVGMVGFARSIGFVTRIGAASEVLNDATQISADITTGGGASATPGATASGGGGAIVRDPPATTARATPPNVATGGAPAAVPADAVDAEEAAVGGGGAGGGAGASGSESAAGGSGGGSGAPSYWDGVLQSMLTLLGQNTTHMCGPNTCNAGQVCCNVSCGICVAPGATCDQTVCAGAARTPSAARCGSGQCNDGQVCCNPSCGICAAPGETCATQSCP